MTESDLQTLAERFEAATLPQPEWTHQAHVAVALYFVRHHSERALETMRAGIVRLNAFHGVPQTPEGGYHDTLTMFWVRYIGRILAQHGDLDWDSLYETVQIACADRKVPLRHYSRELLMSWQARTSLVEPDLAPI